jgi:hypothetical protein
MIYNFLSNLLEPVAYLVFAIAFSLETRKDKSTKVKVLLVHYVLSTIYMSYAAAEVFYDNDNRWLYNLLCVQTAIAICYYFHQLFSSIKKKFIIKCLVVINVFYFLINNIVFGKLFLFDSIGYALLSASVSIMGFLYFYGVIKNVRIRQFDFNFWLVSGYLIYFLVSFAIFLTYHNLTNRILSTYTEEERRLLTALWGVHNILLFLSAMTTLIGSVWITYRNR